MLEYWPTRFNRQSHGGRRQVPDGAAHPTARMWRTGLRRGAEPGRAKNRIWKEPPKARSCQPVRLCRSRTDLGVWPRSSGDGAGHGRDLWVRPVFGRPRRSGMWAADGRPAKVGRIRGSRAPPVVVRLVVLCVNARAARPCAKAPGGTAKRRLQAQQKSAWRYSRNSKRRLKAQQKSAYRYSRS